MNKKQLKKELSSIQDQYGGVESKDSNLLNRSYLEPYVQCLNNPDLKGHLIEAGLVDPGSNMENELKYFDNVEGIIEAFKYDLEALADDELIISKELKLQRLKNLKYQKRITKDVINHQPSNASMAISQLYGKISFTDDVNGNDAKGLYSPDIVKTIEKQEKLLAKGDLSSLENMLHSQTHTLNAIFNKMTIHMSNATELQRLEGLGRIALKAQAQCRQSISTLAEIKGIKKTTFIHQLNNATNQQVNNGAEENLNDSSNEKVIDHVDRGNETGRTGPDKSDETLALSKNSGGAETLITEQLQTRDAVSADNRVAETVGPIESSRTGS